MACDYVVHYECQAKLDFGEGDSLVGTEKLLEAVKAQNRAELLEEMARSSGKPLEKERITLNLITPEGISEQREVSYGDLVNEASPLERIGPQCSSCPANFLNQPMGCSGALNYPIAFGIEEWIAENIQPADNFGGNLCLQFMTEFQVDGSHTQAMRDAGYFEAKKQLQTVVSKRLFKSIKITTNQVFDAILGAGNPLQPSHVWGILMWFGALKIDGRSLGHIGDREPLDVLLSCSTRDEKLEHVSLEVGERDTDSVICQIQDLLDAMFRCWIEDVPMLISP